MARIRLAGEGREPSSRRLTARPSCAIAGARDCHRRVCVFIFSKGTSFLMPGPLTSAHGAIKACNTCHSKSGSGKVSWVHGLVAADRLADSKACITCHKMPDTAFNAHGAIADVLQRSTGRLTKIAAQLPQPQSARAQSMIFPAHDGAARDLTCATCHQEHQGVNFNLNKMSSEQCRSCHVVKFDSFDGNHPKFDSYPFKRRTRIVYDHTGHFEKHFPEVAKKYPEKRIPATCSSCHNSSADKRIMAVAPFEQTCATCHLDQIKGKERASGPKGIAFLTLPGLDLQALKNKSAAIGEWPDASDAALTPFMKVMISRNERGRDLIKTVDGLNLQDLTSATDEQIKAVTSLTWEIKTLFYALISGKASDVLGDLTIGGGAKLSAALVTDLTASLPRDVLIRAQQQWLPNLATEMANGTAASGPDPRDPQKSSSSPVSSEPMPAGLASPDAVSGPDAQQTASEPGTQAEGSEAVSTVKRDPPPCMVRVLGQCLMFKGQNDEAAAATNNASAAAKSDGGKTTSSGRELPGAMRAGLKDAGPATEPEAAAGKTGDAGKQAQAKGANPSDELLFPTEEELRDIKAFTKDAGRAAQPEDAAGKAEIPNADASAGAVAKLQTPAAPVISIESKVDPESWAEYGGWYGQDYEIFYRPTGHKDKFNYSWLFLTGPQAAKGETSPAAAVFEFLTSKDAQGSCTKCHSVDDLQGKGRAVNFSQPAAAMKQGRFTTFIHEPHFSPSEKSGCLSCHNLEKGRPYLKSYEHGNPLSFVSNFAAVKKDLCQSCHNRTMARQDCLTCHKYHVNGVVTPIMSTNNPTQ